MDKETRIQELMKEWQERKKLHHIPLDEKKDREYAEVQYFIEQTKRKN